LVSTTSRLPISTLFPYTTLFRSGEGWENRDLDRAVLVLGILERPVQLLHERDRLQVVQVHLPVSRDQRGTGCYAHPSTSRPGSRSEEHTSELQSRENIVCRLLLE